MLINNSLLQPFILSNTIKEDNKQTETEEVANFVNDENNSIENHLQEISEEKESDEKFEVCVKMETALSECAATVVEVTDDDPVCVNDDIVMPNILTNDLELQKELSKYYILELDKEYNRDIKDNIGKIAKSLIPDIERTRRKICSNFKMKLFNADYSADTKALLNFIFVSVDENGNYDDKVIFERTDIAGFRILLE